MSCINIPVPYLWGFKEVMAVFGIWKVNLHSCPQAKEMDQRKPRNGDIGGMLLIGGKGLEIQCSGGTAETFCELESVPLLILSPFPSSGGEGRVELRGKVKKIMMAVSFKKLRKWLPHWNENYHFKVIIDFSEYSKWQEMFCFMSFAKTQYPLTGSATLVARTKFCKWLHWCPTWLKSIISATRRWCCSIQYHG